MDWDDRDLDAFRQSVSEVVLRKDPEGSWGDLLSETDVDIVIASKARFDVADLYNLPWAKQITMATLQCDRFGGPRTSMNYPGFWT